MEEKVALRDPSHSSAGEATLKSAYLTVQKVLVEQNTNVIEKHTLQLKNFKSHVDQILSKLTVNINDCESNIKRLNIEATELDAKVTKYEVAQKAQSKQAQHRETIKNLNEKYLTICKQRVDIASKINYKILPKITIEDRKAPVNQLFKWMIVCLYSTPENKYYWPNFQEEVFEKDNAKDLQERLGKVSSLQVKEEQRLKTEEVLKNYAQIAASPELSDPEVQVNCEHFRNIIDLYNQAIQIGKGIRASEEAIKTEISSAEKSNDEHIRYKARSDAIKDRNHVITLYLNQLKELRANLSSKSSNYSQKIDSAEKFSKDKSSYTPNTDLGEKRDECTCQIY